VSKVCDREASIMRRPCPTRGCCAIENKMFIILKCGRVPRDTAWRALGWRPMAYRICSMVVRRRNVKCNVRENDLMILIAHVRLNRKQLVLWKLSGEDSCDWNRA
jgi:hypothetical protein